MKKTKKTRNQMRFPSQSLMATINAKNVRKSNFYRSHLEKLLGKTVIVTGVIREWQENKIGGRWSIRFCLDTLKVLNYNCEDTEHLWINCEPNFLYRNKLKTGDSPVMRGRFYEYKKNDSYGNPVRNIGFKLECVLDKEEGRKYLAS